MDIAKEQWEHIPTGDGIDEAARTYAAGMHNNPFSHYRDIAFALGVTGRRMLDAGCGTGTWAFAFSPLFERIDGCDLSEPRIALSNALARQFDIGNTHFPPRQRSRIAVRRWRLRFRLLLWRRDFVPPDRSCNAGICPRPETWRQALYLPKWHRLVDVSARRARGR